MHKLKQLLIKMKSPVLTILAIALCLCPASASVFLPHDMNTRATGSSMRISNKVFGSRELSRRNMPKKSSTAMAIPGYGLAEQVIVGGFGNFLSIFNLILTGRILLTWIPQAAGVAALQPLYQVTDPYLNLFRGIVPSIGGLDLSPLAAFFFLSVMTNAVAAVGCELTPEMQKKLKKTKRFGVPAGSRGKANLNLYK